MAEFTPGHRGGSGTPLVCVHGFTEAWRTWDLVLPALERDHDVLAPTLAGHAGGPPLGDDASATAIVDGVERAMDEAGFERAHIAGNCHMPQLDVPAETATLITGFTRR